MLPVLQVAGKTDVGLVRKNNEDNFGYDTRSGIFVLCDGMGGQAAGERASKIGVDTVLEYFARGSRLRDETLTAAAFGGVSQRANALGHAIQVANQAIHAESNANSSYAGMGSTIVAVLVEGEYFSVANVGDSRIYLVRNGTIQQLTSDHSLVMEQVRRGLITVEEAERSEVKNVILRSLGVEESIDPDLADHELLANDVLLLCSDGLSHFVPDDELLAIINAADDLEKACDDLIEAAKRAGGDDNITCILVRAVEQSRSLRLLDMLFQGKNRFQKKVAE